MTTQASYLKIKQILSSSLAEQVRFTNETFGNTDISALETLDTESREQFSAAVVNQAKLIVSEAEEMVDALNKKSRSLLRDGIADVLVTTLGMPCRFAFDVDEDGIESFLETQKGIKSIDGSVEWDSPALKEAIKDILNSSTLILAQAYNRDFKGVAEHTEETIYKTLNLALFMNVDVVDDMLEVTKSNLSKVCPDEADAEQTQLKYKVMGVPTYREPCPTFDGFIIKVQETVRGTDGKEYPKGKFLKSVGNFVEPLFE